MFTNVNQQVADRSYGRLFAVVYIASRQFKVTAEDIIMILANPSFPDVGEKIVLNKVCVCNQEVCLNTIIDLYW